MGYFNKFKQGTLASFTTLASTWLVVAVPSTASAQMQNLNTDGALAIELLVTEIKSKNLGKGRALTHESKNNIIERSGASGEKVWVIKSANESDISASLIAYESDSSDANIRDLITQIENKYGRQHKSEGHKRFWTIANNTDKPNQSQTLTLTIELADGYTRIVADRTIKSQKPALPPRRVKKRAHKVKKVNVNPKSSGQQRQKSKPKTMLKKNTEF